MITLDNACPVMDSAQKRLTATMTTTKIILIAFLCMRVFHSFLSLVDAAKIRLFLFHFIWDKFIEETTENMMILDPYVEGPILAFVWSPHEYQAPKTSS